MHIVSLTMFFDIMQKSKLKFGYSAAENYQMFSTQVASKIQWKINYSEGHVVVVVVGGGGGAVVVDVLVVVVVLVFSSRPTKDIIGISLRVTHIAQLVQETSSRVPGLHCL